MTEKMLRKSVLLLTIIIAVYAVSSCTTTPAPEKTDSSLIDLISSGRSAEAKRRLTGSESVDQKNAQGQSLLHIAALRNDAEMVQFLLSMNASKETMDNEGDTPLAAAVDAGCLDAARVLAMAGSNVFSVNLHGVAVYRMALDRGTDTFNSIITQNTVNQRDSNGKTLLHYAVADLNEDAVTLILRSDGNVSAADSTGMTPLAVAYTDPFNDASARIAAALLIAGAEPLLGEFAYFETAVLKRNPGMRFEEGKTPLHIASANGHTGFVNYLIERRVQVNVKDVSSATPLHEAVRNGHIQCTFILLKAGADPNQQDSAGNTPLHLVMPAGSRSEIFSALLNAGADPNKKDSYGETPLHIAARLGMSENIIRTLISHGADTNERNKKGVTPLSLAIERNQIAQANLFVRLGADIHAEDIDENTALIKALKSGLVMTQAVIIDSNVQSRDSRGRTPLHIAIINQSEPDIINYLIEKKADVNARDKNGDTPLHIAVRNNTRDTGEILLAYGADVFNPNVAGESALRAALSRMGGRQDWVLNSNVIKSSDGAGNTPLHLAAEWQLNSVVSLIVEKGGDLNARNSNGETPLFNAVKADSSATVRTLLSQNTAERAADINARDFLGNTALHACINWSAENAANMLLSYDARTNGRRLINARNLAGKTTLHEAARTENITFLQMLLANGADINAVDETGKTPLTDAIQGNRPDSVRLLLEKGASPVMQDMYGRNAFHEAVEYSAPEIISLIRKAGGNPMARDSYGRTPLSLAFRKNRETVMAVIGTNTNLVDSDGNTPLHIAVMEHSSTEILQSLIDAKIPVNNRNRTGTTALLLAVKNNDETAARILLASGADPFASDNSGENVVSLVLTKIPAFIPLLAEYAAGKTDTIGDGLLHYAARLGTADSVKELLNMPRIDRRARNIAGETPYDIAVRWQRPQIAQLLE
ncbi:ankyrin repeat domain-containing protein [Brucepastera parasyntrophica]|uniref:ankyrin repeat domain-containing protein n=1 Tax=Brucepastera parasyntrophica TaxID=2880008 RepID=UPI002108B657|nr:ankyrin repeat domain-containing protein [Brucepastera parasyntrophica]ULQ59519.1 ankyrin repeat domain-containing protein [Brucepastera parasyntrophica]